MRNKALLLGLFVAGLAASFAVGSSAGILEGTTTGTTQATTTTGEHDHGKKDKSCHNVSLHGTAGATSFTLAIDKSSKAGKDLGSSANVSFSGQVSVKARLCGTGTGATVQLRELKVGEHQGEDNQH